MWIIYRGHEPLAAFFIEPCKCSAHKAGQKELPPLEKPSEVMSSWLSMKLLQIYSDLLQITDICAHFHISQLNEGKRVDRRRCMRLCSQGPHLWPFISSQVKGLRDNEAHRQILMVRKGSRWRRLFGQPRQNRKSNTSLRKHISVSVTNTKYVFYRGMLKSVPYD